LAQYTGTLTSPGYYSFDLASMISNELKIMRTDANAVENLKLRLVPVRVSGSSTSSGSFQVTSVKQEFLMSGTSLRSSKNTTSPMRLKMIYSGF